VGYNLWDMLDDRSGVALRGRIHSGRTLSCRPPTLSVEGRSIDPNRIPEGEQARRHATGR
jgi:hypothetical protein